MYVLFGLLFALRPVNMANEMRIELSTNNPYNFVFYV